MKADLHIHSDISDGSKNISQIMEIAKEKNVSHISITNHDTVAGLEDAEQIASLNNIKFIRGIEISAYDFKRKRKVHILGYGFNKEAKNIRFVCRPTLVKRNKNSLSQLQTIISEGYMINKFSVLEKAKNSGILYKQHIMKTLIEEGYTKELYGSLYKKIFKGKGICNSDIDYIDARVAVEAIVNDGGVAVLAHPGELDSFDIAHELIDYGLSGIELNHPKNNDDDKIKIFKIASKYNLILTGGSDYHGEYGSNVNIGDYSSTLQSLKVLYK